MQSRDVGVLITRPASRGEKLCDALIARGFAALHYPCLDFLLLTNTPAWQAGVKQLATQDWLIVISPQAADIILPVLKQQADTTLKIACVGGATSATLQAAGVKVDYHPTTDWSSEGLLADPMFQNVNNVKIAVVRGEGGREKIDLSLQARGAQVLTLAAYQRILPKVTAAKQMALQQWLNQPITHIVFAASFQTLTHLETLAGASAWQQLKKTCLVVMSDRIKQLAEKNGFESVLVLDRFDEESMIEFLLKRGQSHVR